MPGEWEYPLPGGNPCWLTNSEWTTLKTRAYHQHNQAQQVVCVYIYLHVWTIIIKEKEATNLKGGDMGEARERLAGRWLEGGKGCNSVSIKSIFFKKGSHGRDSSVVKSVYLSRRGNAFSFQRAHWIGHNHLQLQPQGIQNLVLALADKCTQMHTLPHRHTSILIILTKRKSLKEKEKELREVWEITDILVKEFRTNLLRYQV